MSKHPAYKSWVNARLRCTNPENKDYKNYGGRGITMSNNWTTSFESFYQDMSDPPPGFTLERINNDLGYSKENCKWSSRKEQNNNRRIRKTNKWGIPGIYWYNNKYFQVYHDSWDEGRVYLGSTIDFFEACCLRKSYESYYEDSCKF